MAVHEYRARVGTERPRSQQATALETAMRSEHSRISPSNPIRPRISPPREPKKALPLDRAHQKHKVGTKLALESVRSGSPAARTPKKSGRSSARGGAAPPSTSRGGSSKRGRPGGKAAAKQASNKGAEKPRGGERGDAHAAPKQDAVQLSSSEGSEEMRAIAALDLNSAEMLKVAGRYNSIATTKEAAVGSRQVGLSLVLGNLLAAEIDEGLQKDKQYAEEMFRSLDVNGDGTGYSMA